MIKTLTMAAISAMAIFVAPAKAETAALVFYADWCAKCKILGPKVESQAAVFENAGVEMVKLDFTERTDANMASQRMKAVEIGAGAVFDANVPGTGFIILVDTEDGTERGRITSSMSEMEIADTVAMAAHGDDMMMDDGMMKKDAMKDHDMKKDAMMKDSM